MNAVPSGEGPISSRTAIQRAHNPIQILPLTSLGDPSPEASCGGRGMEATVDDLSAAYDDFVAAAAVVLEARAQSGGEKTAATDAALEAFKQRWEFFRVACDHAEELVESIRQRIGSECLVDEATGSAAAGSGPSPMAAAPGIKPISAVRLEQMSKAVRWLVIELQHGAGGASAPGAAGSGGAATPNAGAGPQHPEEGGQ